MTSPTHRERILPRLIEDRMSVEGSKANTTGQVAYTRAEAKALFVQASEASRLPIIYLSAGVDDDVFRETLELASESGLIQADTVMALVTSRAGESGMSTWSSMPSNWR